MPRRRGRCAHDVKQPLIKIVAAKNTGEWYAAVI
jgi:hypothetical protein